jgi:hypothetical protein
MTTREPHNFTNSKLQDSYGLDSSKLGPIGRSAKSELKNNAVRVRHIIITTSKLVCCQAWKTQCLWSENEDPTSLTQAKVFYH